MPTPYAREFERLAQLARQRRTELGLPITTVIERAGGISKDTYRRVETARPLRDSTYAVIDVALEWMPGSCLAILGGGDPVIADDSQRMSFTTSKIEPEDVSSAVSTAIIATRGDLTGDEIRAINDKVLAELKRRGLI
jgi:hypothetical protein